MSKSSSRVDFKSRFQESELTPREGGVALGSNEDDGIIAIWVIFFKFSEARSGDALEGGFARDVINLRKRKRAY